LRYAKMPPYVLDRQLAVGRAHSATVAGCRFSQNSRIDRPSLPATDIVEQFGVNSGSDMEHEPWVQRRITLSISRVDPNRTARAINTGPGG
jgi:hypothetical protein